MAGPQLRRVLRWLIAIEDDPSREHLMGGGWPLIDAAIAPTGVMPGGDADGFAGLLLPLHQRGLIHIEYHLLAVDQGYDSWRGQPSYHLQQVQGLETTTDGRAWVREEPSSSTTMNFAGPVGQVAGRDVHNSVSFTVFIENLERAVDGVDAPEEAKQEARTVLQRLRQAAGAGGKVVQETSTEVIAKVLAQSLNLPPE